MSDKYARVLRLVGEHPWAVLPATLDVVVEVLMLRAEGVMFTDEEIHQRLGAAGPQRREARTVSNIAVLPLHGVIAPKMNAMTQISGGTSADVFGAVFQRVMDNPEISAVVVDADTPGGSVFGVEELATTIRSARGSKPIIAVVNHMAASAGYWLASQADEIIASPSSMLGSIGCIAAHTDLTAAAAKAGIKTTYITAGKYKSEAAPDEALSDEARADMQAKVDEYYRVFVNAVAKGRGVTPQAVREGFGQGRLVQAREAVKLGMADGIGTLDQVIERLASGSRTVGKLAAKGQRLFTAVEQGEDEVVILAPQAGGLFTIDGVKTQVDPNEDGSCPDGYEKGDDDMCHLMPEDAKAARAAVADLRRQLAARGA
jgi:signal peptide peptidase SppA